MENKKSVMGPVISVFVMVLVVAILAGLTFLFIASLKTNVIDTTVIAKSVVNESGAFTNQSGYTLATAGEVGFRNPVISVAINGSSGTVIVPANYTLSSAGVLTNTTDFVYQSINLSYGYSSVGNLNAYQAVNDTEAAGATIVGYLPLIFLALIFGTILTLVLRIILPYINIGQQMGGQY